MAGERVKLTVQERTVLGSPESRRLRKQGLIPGVLYGREKPVPIAIPERELRTALTGAGGLHAVLDVVVGEGKTHSSVLKEFQQDRLRGTITHVDLQEVRLDQPIQAVVTITLVGDAAGTKEGGVLSQVTNEVNVEALPLEIPEHIDVDVSAMHIGDTLRLAEVSVPDGVTLLDDPEETVVATVTQPTRVEVPDELLEEGEEQATGTMSEGEKGESASESSAEPSAAAAGGEGTVPG